MRQIWTSRKVWLPILLLFTAVLIFACRDRAWPSTFDGTGLYHASPLNSAIETVPVSFHGQLRKNVYTGSATYPVYSSVTTSASSSAATRAPMFTAATKLYPNPRPSTASPLTGHSAAPRSACGANILVEGDRVLATFGPASCTPPSPSPSETVPITHRIPGTRRGIGAFSVVHLLPRRLNHQKVSGQTHPANSTTSR